jgi:hypothetical protein
MPVQSTKQQFKTKVAATTDLLLSKLGENAAKLRGRPIVLQGQSFYDNSKDHVKDAFHQLLGIRQQFPTASGLPAPKWAYTTLAETLSKQFTGKSMEAELQQFFSLLRREMAAAILEEPVAPSGTKAHKISCDETGPSQPTHSPEAKVEVATEPPKGSHVGKLLGTERRDRVDRFLRACNDETPTKITRKHIWAAAKHKSGRQFQYWQGASPKATRADDTTFGRLLRMAPAEFLSLIERKGLIKPKA